jgi:hypothetical protein
MNISQAAAGSMLSALGALLNSGTLTMYSGTQPASPETALSGNTALVSWTFSSTAFGSATFASGNEQIVDSLTNTTANPTASGTAVFARATASGGTAVIDFTVGTSGTDIIIGNTGIETGVPVTLSSLTLKLPAV